MKRPSALTLDEEREVARLIGSGRSAIWARQFVFEERFRDRRSQRREGNGGNRPVSDSLNSSHVNSVLHAPDRRSEGSHEVANPLHARTNSLRGQD